MRAGRIEQLDTAGAGLRGAGHRVRRRRSSACRTGCRCDRRRRRLAARRRAASTATCRVPASAHGEVAAAAAARRPARWSRPGSRRRARTVGVPGARWSTRSSAAGTWTWSSRSAATGCTRRCRAGRCGGWARQLLALGQPVTAWFPAQARDLLRRRRRPRSPGRCRSRPRSPVGGVTPWPSPPPVAPPSAPRVVDRARRGAAPPRRCSRSCWCSATWCSCRWSAAAPGLRQDGAGAATSAAFGRPGDGRHAAHHGRPRARLAGHRAGARHAAGLGGDPAAAAAAACCASLPILPIVVPAVASGDRLGVPALAPARLPQRAAAQPALVERPRRGAGRHLLAAVDRHHHRLRPDRVRLPVRQLRLRQHQLRADRGGRRSAARRRSGCSSGSPCRCCARRWSTAAASRCCSGSGQFTGPLLLGRTGGITVLTTDMYLAVVADARSTTAGPPRSARRCCCSASPWSSSRR